MICGIFPFFLFCYLVPLTKSKNCKIFCSLYLEPFLLCLPTCLCSKLIHSSWFALSQSLQPPPVAFSQLTLFSLHNCPLGSLLSCPLPVAFLLPLVSLSLSVHWTSCLTDQHFFFFIHRISRWLFLFLNQKI